MICQICGGGLRHWLTMPIDARKDEATKFKDVLICVSCATGMVTPRPSPNEVAAFYDLPSYYTHNDEQVQSDRPMFLDRVLTRLAWTVDRSRFFFATEIERRLRGGATIIDIGCGQARLCRDLQVRGFDVVGIEPDDEAREIAVRHGITVYSGTAEKLPAEIAGKEFDLVVMSHSLEHCLDPVTALRNAFALTKVNGLLYIEVPNAACIHFRTMTICGFNFDIPRHLWFFTPDGLKNAISKAGFNCAEFIFGGFTRHHVPEWRKWEMTIYDRLRDHGHGNTIIRHTYVRSLLILLQSAFVAPQRKYDSFGVIASKSR